MQTIEKSALFTEIETAESAEINGGCGQCWNPCWNPCWNSGWSSGGYGGGGFSGSSASAVNQTTNVNVLYND